MPQKLMSRSDSGSEIVKGWKSTVRLTSRSISVCKGSVALDYELVWQNDSASARASLKRLPSVGNIAACWCLRVRLHSIFDF